MIRVQGYGYSEATKSWTEPVVYEARDRIEAIRWINFQRDWLKDLKIDETSDKEVPIERRD